VLHLPGDGTLANLACKPGIEDERVRELYGLTHLHKVA
jgi:hypothetical protein